MKKLNIGIVQQSCTSSINENHDKTVQEIRDLASKGAELIVLQELHSSLYFCQTEDTNQFDLAVEIPSETTDFFGQIAR